MGHICGTFQKSSLGVEDFTGAPILPLIGLPNFANTPDVAKIKMLYINPHHAHIWDCSAVIPGSVGFEGEGDTQILPFFDRGAASILCPYSNRVLPRFSQNLKMKTQISPMQTLFSTMLIIRIDNND